MVFHGIPKIMYTPKAYHIYCINAQFTMLFQDKIKSQYERLRYVLTIVSIIELER